MDVRADDQGPRTTGPKARDLDDPVRRRRRVIAVWTRRANRAGYLFFGVAIVVFVVALATEFTGAMATLVTASMIVGSILLAPAIVLGYAVKAAEKEDRGPHGSARRH
ncbi:MAG: hypothetical protein ACO3SP_02690 [Ilumatobacteraceae bacterium]